MTTTPTAFAGEEAFKMIKKFYIVSCAALVACLGLFPQDAGATARQSEATTLAPAASASANIQLAAQRVTKKRKSAANNVKKAKGKSKKGAKSHKRAGKSKKTTPTTQQQNSQSLDLWLEKSISVLVQPD